MRSGLEKDTVKPRLTRTKPGRLAKLCLVLSILTAAGCARAPQAADWKPAVSLPEDAEQAIVVQRNDEIPTHVQISTWQRTDGVWAHALPAMRGVIGNKGFAAPGQKREGDGKTPSGVFKLGQAFGYAPGVTTRLAYRQAGPDDFWVDDPQSPQYNQWVVGKPTATSFERMKRDDEYYRLGVVIEYNTDPIVSGLGSAIFLHIWGSADSSTAGCVALAAEDVTALLRWLDRRQHPVIVLGEPSANTSSPNSTPDLKK